MKRKITKNKVFNTINGYVFLAPLIVGMALFTFYPIVQSLIYSFQDFNLFGGVEPAGFANYEKVFGGDSEMKKVALNTLLYVIISVPLNLFLSYFVAVLVNQKKSGVKLFRVLYYLPVVIPGVVSGVLWKDILNPSDGMMNTIFSAIGLPENTFFSSAKTSLFAVLFMGLWGIGGGMILWLSAFKIIPDSGYEAADLDGAGVFTKVFKITIPLSTSMIFYNLIMGLIGAMQVNSTLIYAPREGRGYENSVYFVGVKIYREAFVRNNLGYASAIAWVLFIVIAILTLVCFKTNKWVYYGVGD